jgi:hypothetical protein
METELGVDTVAATRSPSINSSPLHRSHATSASGLRTRGLNAKANQDPASEGAGA